MSEPLLQVRDLRVTFRGGVEAVSGVDLDVGRGEVLGVVGESGSGKSVALKAVLGLLPPTARVTGSVRFRGRELLGASDRAMRRLRGGPVAMIFQDPLSALNPVVPVGAQIAEALRLHDRSMRGARARARVAELLDRVAIPQAAERARAYPHEFSGGMRQRAMIAMAMANDPDLLIADEPTTALDVTVQAQILDLLRDLRERRGLGLVLVTHDLGVVAGVADRVAVMYAGRIVEEAPVDALFADPRHPYTRGLIASVPTLGPRRDRLRAIEGAPPDPSARPPGCAFAPRCPIAAERCRTETPVRRPAGASLAACHFAGGVPA